MHVIIKIIIFILAVNLVDDECLFTIKVIIFTIKIHPIEYCLSIVENDIYF